jgi:hypothetical protein
VDDRRVRAARRPLDVRAQPHHDGRDCVTGPRPSAYLADSDGSGSRTRRDQGVVDGDNASGQSAGLLEADARTRTGDPFITREKTSEGRAGTRGHARARSRWNLAGFTSPTVDARPARARADVPVAPGRGAAAARWIPSARGSQYGRTRKRLFGPEARQRDGALGSGARDFDGISRARPKSPRLGAPRGSPAQRRSRRGRRFRTSRSARRGCARSPPRPGVP